MKAPTLRGRRWNGFVFQGDPNKEGQLFGVKDMGVGRPLRGPLAASCSRPDVAVSCCGSCRHVVHCLRRAVKLPALARRHRSRAVSACSLGCWAAPVGGTYPLVCWFPAVFLTTDPDGLNTTESRPLTGLEAGSPSRGVSWAGPSGL